MIVKNIRKQINGNTIFDNISFSLNTQDKVGLVGVNGSGKSTLLKVLGGIMTTDNGVINLNGDSIGYLYQEIPIIYNDYTIEKYIKEIVGFTKLEKRLHFLENNLSEDNMDQSENSNLYLAIVRSLFCSILHQKNIHLYLKKH